VLNTRPNSLLKLISLFGSGERGTPSSDRCTLECFCWFRLPYRFCIIVKRSLRFGFSGGFLKGLLLNACHERLSLAFFVRRMMVQFVFNCRFSDRQKSQ
jgi:hypothetical protein